MTRRYHSWPSPLAKHGNLHRELIVNLVPIGAGGGLQNALSFIDGLSRRSEWRDRVIIACRAGSLIETTCNKLGLAHWTVPNTLVGRLAFEIRGARKLAKLVRARIIFTLFGGRPWRLTGIRSVSGFAFSNIIQSEIPFWDFLPPHRRVLQKIKDRLRLAQARLSNTIILETDYLAARARSGVFEDRRIEVVKMEPSSLVVGAPRDNSDRATSTIDVLALAGPHPNKRLHLLAPVFDKLNAKANDEPAYRLITTLPENAAYTRTVETAFAAVGASDALENIGPVAPDAVGGLLAQVDAIVNVALLESFSNNWVEAWVSGLPLISTDAEWSRAACGDAAIYVDPANPAKAAATIRDGLSSSARCRLIAAGRAQLERLASQGAKIDRYLQIIEQELAR